MTMTEFMSIGVTDSELMELTQIWDVQGPGVKRIILLHHVFECGSVATFSDEETDVSNELIHTM